LVIWTPCLVSKVWGANRREDVSQGPCCNEEAGIGRVQPTDRTSLNTCSPIAGIRTFENNPQSSHPRCPQCRSRKSIRRCAAGGNLSLGRIKAASEVLVVKLVVCAAASRITTHAVAKKGIESRGSCMIELIKKGQRQCHD